MFESLIFEVLLVLGFAMQCFLLGIILRSCPVDALISVARDARGTFDASHGRRFEVRFACQHHGAVAHEACAATADILRMRPASSKEREGASQFRL